MSYVEEFISTSKCNFISLDASVWTFSTYLFAQIIRFIIRSSIDFKGQRLRFRGYSLGLGFMVQWLRVQGLGVMVYSLGFEIWGLGFGLRVQGLGLGFKVWVQGLGYQVWGLGFMVWGLWYRVQGLGIGIRVYFLGLRVMVLWLGFCAQGLRLNYPSH